MLDQSRTPNVSPEVLRRPQSAMGGGGVVSCVGCGSVISLGNADIVGLGYRCQGCSNRASIAKLAGGGDAASHFSPRERHQLSKSGMELIWIGIGVLTLGAIMMALLFWRVGLTAMLLGGVTIGVGAARRNASY